eukprot:5321300-Pleurochrysis_carterae.AAC.3
MEIGMLLVQLVVDMDTMDKQSVKSKPVGPRRHADVQINLFRRPVHSVDQLPLLAHHQCSWSCIESTQ